MNDRIGHRTVSGILNPRLLGRCVPIIALVAAPAAKAAAVYATSFDDPPFAACSLLVGQDGWSAPPPLSPNAAIIIQGERAHRGQDVRVRGRDLEHQDFINELTGGFYDAIGSYRRAVNFETTGTQVVRVSADVLLDGEKTCDGSDSPFFFSASVSTRTTLTDGGTAGTGELAIASDGRVYGYSGNDNVPTFLASMEVDLDRSHDLAVEVDIGQRTYAFFVDGRGLGTFPFDDNPNSDDPSVDYTTVLARGSLLAYVAPDTDELKKSDYKALYDNFSIKAARRRH